MTAIMQTMYAAAVVLVTRSQLYDGGRLDQRGKMSSSCCHFRKNYGQAVTSRYQVSMNDRNAQTVINILYLYARSLM